MSKRDYLTVDSLSREELDAVLDLADDMRRGRRQRNDLAGCSIGMIFEKPSTRTRISFEVGITELGARAVVLSAAELQLGRGETVEDTARILSGYLHAVVVRTFAQSRLETLARAGTIPVVNALSDAAHPCQVLADLQTIRAHTGGLAGRKLAYIGDGNNVAHSLLRAGAMTGMHVVVACPPGHRPDPAVVRAAEELARGGGGAVEVTGEPDAAAHAADVIYTDVWASMGQEAEREARLQAFRGYQVDDRLLGLAKPDAIVMHCLPAHRGEEITGSVLDGPRSVVWEQAENRLHSQKALLVTLLRAGQT